MKQLTVILAGLTAAEWEVESVRTGARSQPVTVRTIVGELVWTMRGTRRSRFISIATTMVTQRRTQAGATADLVHELAKHEPARLLSELTALAAITTPSAPSATSAPSANTAAGRGNHRTVRHLGACVAALYEICDVSGRSVEVDPLSSGAVAIAASLGASLPITAVLRQCRLIARDCSAVPGGQDSWSVGRGRESYSTPSAIVLFLYGRRGFPATVGG
jgi:hypothetical protein